MGLRRNRKTQGGGGTRCRSLVSVKGHEERWTSTKRGRRGDVRGTIKEEKSKREGKRHRGRKLGGKKVRQCATMRRGERKEVGGPKTKR